MSYASRSPAFDHRRLPWLARAGNAVGALLGTGALAPAKLSEAALLRDARRMTGRPDGDAGAFTTALRTLLVSIEADAGLSLVGRLAMRQQLVRNLSNALRIDAELARDPGIGQEPIVRPVFIVGFPRTGTTLLHRLLACLPDARVPRMWELLWPTPPPRADPSADDARIAAAERVVRGLTYLAPHITTIHPFDAREPEECFYLLENTFMCASVAFYLNVPGYMAWLTAQDMALAYARYRVQLQLLQRRSPGRPWVLKWPGHMMHIETLLGTFPDATVVHTHRNLAAVAPSSCSYSATLRMLFTSGVDTAAMGEEWMRDSRTFVERAMSARDRLGTSRFFDLQYADLIADPLGCVRRICDRLELPCTPVAEDRMRAHLHASAHRPQRPHRYTLAEFGLDRGRVSHAFDDYHRRFGVTTGSCEG